MGRLEVSASAGAPERAVRATPQVVVGLFVVIADALTLCVGSRGHIADDRSIIHPQLPRIARYFPFRSMKSPEVAVTQAC